MNWRKWIRPGLVVTVVAAPLAVFLQGRDIERDVASRVASALAASGQDWVKVTASARDVTISGTAPAPEARQIALQTAQGVVGVRAVADQTVVLPVVSPYVWSVRRSGSQVTLAGSVPSDGVRAAVLAAARRAVPQAEIVDRMALARGAPSSFSAATAFALNRLGGLADGGEMLSDSTLSASGTATDAAAYTGFRDTFAKEAPAAVTVSSVDILPARASRFVWSVNLDSASVTVAGNIPSEAARQTLTSGIKAALPNLPFVDAETVASGDPPGFVAAAAFAVAALQRLKRGGVTLDGLSLDIAGEAKSAADYAALLDTLSSGLPAGVQVVSAAVTPASVAPYLWQGDVADGRVTLTGYAPSLDVRSQLSAFAKTALMGVAVDDHVLVARGEPRMDWVGAVKFAVGQLALLGRGSVVITDTGYTVSGEARDPKAYATIVDQNNHTLPAGLVLKAATVTAPRATQYRFTAERRDGRIVVAGFVARDEDRQAVLAAAHRVAGAADVVDNMTFAGGAPAGFVTAATAAVRSLNRLAGGRAEISDQSVTLSGTAYQDAAVAEIADDLRDGLPPGFVLAKVDVFTGEPGQPMTASACRDQLQDVLKAGRIEFDANNPVVTTDSLGVLDRVAATIQRCPTASIEVGVHSDNDGVAQALKDRTQARADAIVDYLAGAGVRREQLTGVGYGLTKPIADNSTPNGRAANRRVEFSVAGAAGG